MNIIIDTREQRPLLFTRHKTTRRKLDEGDYNTIELEDKVVFERKTFEDLYGSIIQGHARFKAEILRSIAKGKTFFLFLEGRLENFYAMNWSARKLETTPETLRKIVETMISRYDIKLIECTNRKTMAERIIDIIKEYNEMEEKENG